MNFTKDYNVTIKKKWQDYIVGDMPMPENDSKIRDFIYESWKRSKAWQIPPFEVKDKRLSDSALKKLQKRNRQLIQVAHPYIQHLYSFIKGTNFTLTLTDADGYVLDIISDDTMIRAHMKKSALAIGCCRSEQYAGTNGIGTCLAVGKPIQIYGSEHYIQPHHEYVCSAAPIRNVDGQIIGCLDVVGPISLPHNHTLAMVSASADGIEKELKMTEAYNQLSTITNQMHSTIQAIDSGIIMFDATGKVSQYNKRACQILKLSPNSIDNENINNILEFPSSSFDFQKADQDIQNLEISLTTHNGELIPVYLSLSHIKNEGEKRLGTVLVISEQSKIHKLVNRSSGFTATYTFDSIIGKSPAIEAAKNIARAAARSTSNVLILGESGTGKELMAQSIHNASDRAKGPFIAINCGSLPKGLIESELFGYERGAFTGANKDGQPGKFELANGGTIFLDEIGDMPLELQASLLRVLQTKEIVRIGGKHKKEIDVRIMAATNVDLLESVKRKEFRSDLYYRLNVLPIEVPSLRERKSDIELLLENFVLSISNIMGKQITKIDPDAQAILTNYDWPGNIRELENVIERAVNLALPSDHSITIDVLPTSIIEASKQQIVPAKTTTSTTAQLFSTAQHSSKSAENEIAVQNAPLASENPVENRSYQLIVEALKAERGNVTKTSERLGIPKRTLYRRIQKYNINKFRLL